MVVAVAWEWHRFRFRFAEVRALRELQSRLRSRLIGKSRETTVASGQLLVGGSNGMSGYTFATRAGYHRDPSTRIGESFYVDLLSAYDRDGETSLTDERLQSSGYFQRIAAAKALTGHYRGQRTLEGMTEVTREYIDRYVGRSVPYRPGRSRPGSLPLVRRVADSACYQVLDGHHRLAIDIHRGATELKVAVAPGFATTLAQNLLLDMSWLDGSRRLYQPVDFPEVQGWGLMRKCSDRLAMMIDHLSSARILDARGLAAGADAGTRPTYLDVGSCYGWFVSELGKIGFDARGIEADPLAKQIGPLAYDLEADQITIGDCIELMQDEANGADVVSCFSVLHHFVMGRGSSSPQELMRLLDERTGKVLFLDTGQSHESWFRLTLPQWTPEYIAAWIREHSTFTNVTAIGVDEDGVGEFEGKFGRTLFACTR